MAEAPVAVDPDRKTGAGVEQLDPERAVRLALDPAQLGRQPSGAGLVARDAGGCAQRQRAAKEEPPVDDHENLSALRLPNRMSPSSLARNCA